MNKHKDLQEERMRGYFIQATKDIIRSEGIKALSVRNIADQAGYSYATMYNYFRNVKELIFICVEDFLGDCQEFVDEKVKPQNDPLITIKETAKAYVMYFLEYPGVFELFFIDRLGDFGPRSSNLDLITSSFDIVSSKAFEICMEQNRLNEEQILTLQANLKYTITGLLIFYLNRLTPSSYQEFIAELDVRIEDNIKSY